MDGQAVGVVKDEDSLNQLLDSMKDRYTTENTVSVRFLDTVATEPVYEVNDLMTIREMEQALQANGNGSTTYTVVAGDTFNAIAYANDMSVSDLKALNPSVDINRLMVGDVLNVKELTPAFGGDGGRCDLCGVDSPARWKRSRTPPCTKGAARSSPREWRARPRWTPPSPMSMVRRLGGSSTARPPCGSPPRR